MPGASGRCLLTVLKVGLSTIQWKRLRLTRNVMTCVFDEWR